MRRESGKAGGELVGERLPQLVRLVQITKEQLDARAPLMIPRAFVVEPENLGAVPDERGCVLHVAEVVLDDGPYGIEVETPRELEASHPYKSAFMVTVPSFSSTA